MDEGGRPTQQDGYNVGAILYDVTYHVEWPAEKEVVGGSQQDEIPIYTNVQSVRSSISRWTWATARAFGFPVRTGAPCMLPPNLVKLINSQGSWLLAKSPDGNYIAVLRDNCLEIRSSKEEHNSTVGRCNFSKDPQPQWRKVVWSQHSTMVAFSESNGLVHVCDLRGMVLLSFHSSLAEERSFFDNSSAISSLLFIDNEIVKHKGDGIFLIVVAYSGAAACLEINPTHERGYETLFRFDFSVSHTKGVSSVVYIKEHNMILVGGCTGYAVDDRGVPKATKYGITAWRLLSDEPYLKSFEAFSDAGDYRSKPGILRRLSTVPSGLGKKFRAQIVDGVYLMALSPCHKYLATVHLSGALSLWEIPSLRHKRIWKSGEQPFHGETEADDAKSLGSSSKKSKVCQFFNDVIDCKWWSETAVILARCSGSVTVVQVSGRKLENLFGDQCEWLEPAPRITSCKDDGFLAMECETQIKSLKRQRDDSVEEAPKEDGDEYDPFLDDTDSEDSSPSISERLSNYTKSTMYDLTEIEYFRPPRKRPKLVTKSYRLLAITKTTPEKLFERKLEDEEYGEALALAQRYNLDGDKVFQRQWRKSPVSVASIQDYLSKITKRLWVMHECCERVPEELDAARELLNFALRVTDMDELAGKQKHNNFEDDFEEDSDYEEYEGFNVEEQRNQEIQQRKKFVLKWSKSVDFSNLTLEQKELIRVRKKIFKYLDRLSTYEYLLGGYDAARERYNRDKFANFRQREIFASTLEYARDGDWKAVDTLWTFHGDELREHWLPILSNIPNNVMPSEYKLLLPKITEDGTVSTWPEIKHRDPEDWCESDEYQHAVMPLMQHNDPTDEFYHENPALIKFRTSTPTSETVQKWFLYQAAQMDVDARDIEGALDMLAIGTENSVVGLQGLTRDFETLETLVYECDYDPGLTLARLQRKSKLEQLKMLLEKSSREMYLKNFHRWGLPFLKSCNEVESAGVVLQKYLTGMAEEDLTFPTLIFVSFLQDKSMPTMILTLESLADLALECIYLSSQPEQLKFVKQIHEVLTKLDKTVVTRMQDKALEKIAQLESHIYACSKLESHGVKVTPNYIREVENDRDKVKKVFVRLSRTVGGREPPLSKNEWNNLLKDMLLLREKVFAKTCSLESAVCLEIFVESLLTSGSLSNFQIAGERMMRTAEEEHEATRGRLYPSLTQKLSYESSVALVIKSSQEFFDASTPNTNDNMLSLARECLLLITDRPRSIHERLDLIEGVVLLQRFGVDKLPLQVRLTEDRLSLVQKAIDASNETYRKTEPLLRLAMLLRVCGTNKEERKGQVLSMIVDKALVCDDLESAYCLCQELISMSFTPAWEVCLKLASREDFLDNGGKLDVLAFVSCHCDMLKLVQVMDQICALNCKILRAVVSEHSCPKVIDDYDALQQVEAMDEDPQTAPKSFGNLGGSNPLNKFVHSSAEFLSPAKMLKTTAQGTKAVLSVTGTVLSATSHTTKAMLTNVGNAEWWRNQIDKTLSAIPTTENRTSDVRDNLPLDMNQNFEYQGCPEFYSDAIQNSISRHGLLLQSEQFALPKQLAINQASFRAAQLESFGNQPSSDEESLSVLEELLKLTLPYDFALGLSYLLAIADPDEAYNYLQTLPVSALSLQIGLYYFSLCLVAETGQASVYDMKSSLYDTPPLDLIKHALAESSCLQFEAGSRPERLVFHLNQLKEDLFDFSQGEKLQQLGRGIDLDRFTKDMEYREETVLGLAMTADEEQYKLAVSLAHRSGTDLWLVLITHLEFLFTECQDQLDCAALHERIQTLNMIPELIKKPSEFFDRMDKYIFPFVNGHDHDRLILYFSLLSECKLDEKSFNSTHDLCAISPSTHLKTLRKIKSVQPPLDYKALLSESKSPDRVMKILQPALDATNVQMLAKLMPAMPYAHFKISASMLYLEVANATMWKDVSRSTEETTESINWMPRYESCLGFLRMCHPNDLLAFFEALLFKSDQSKIIPLGIRQDLIKRGVKLVKNQGTKERKNQLGSGVLASGQSFQTVLPAFIQMSKHLDSYSTTFVSDLMKHSMSDEKMMKYLQAYDKSQSRPDQVIDVATMMLSDGCAPTFLQSFFAIVPGNKWTCFAALERCIGEIVEGFSIDNSNKEGVFDRLSRVIAAVSEHEKAKGKILSSAQVINLLRPFCSDASIDAKLRVDVLKLLEDKFELEESEARLLLLHRTRAVIREGWGEEEGDQYLKDVGQDGITEDKIRFELFESLLQSDSCDISKAKNLVTLLAIWPEFKNSDVADASWDGVLLKFTELGPEGGKEIIEVAKRRMDKLPSNTVTSIFKMLLKAKLTLFAIKLALLTNIAELREDLIGAIRNVTQMGPSTCDEEVIILMLQNSIAVHTVGTLYYTQVIEYLLSGECPGAEGHVHRLARQLQDMGHMPEAGTLLLNFRGTHPALRTFNNALSSLKRWLDT